MFSVGGKAMNCRLVYRTTPLHHSYDDDNNKKKKMKNIYLTIHSVCCRI